MKSFIKNWTIWKMYYFSLNSIMKRIEKHFNNVSVMNLDPFQNKLFHDWNSNLFTH